MGLQLRRRNHPFTLSTPFSQPPYATAPATVKGINPVGELNPCRWPADRSLSLCVDLSGLVGHSCASVAPTDIDDQKVVNQILQHRRPLIGS